VPKTDMRIRFKATVIAAALAVLPMATHAAGLGKITVLSALGQPLKAELEVTATRDETPSLQARVAPAEAFRQAGIEYSHALANLRFSREIKERGRSSLPGNQHRPSPQRAFHRHARGVDLGFRAPCARIHIPARSARTGREGATGSGRGARSKVSAGRGSSPLKSRRRPCRPKPVRSSIAVRPCPGRRSKSLLQSPPRSLRRPVRARW
jgi:hypothetical protein